MTKNTPPSFLHLSPEVKDALSSKKPVVSLESTIIAHGMPYPQNLATAREVEQILREKGVTPATCAILGGKIKIGLTDSELELVATQTDSEKMGFRDIPQVLMQKGNGSTTVGATLFLAQLAGIPFMVTGGIGGVHRQVDQSWDISADLTALAQFKVATVCAGVKSILDIEKTLEHLETLGVPVIGFKTKDFPAFYTRKSGFSAPFSVDTSAELAQYLAIKWELGQCGGIVIANPIPEEEGLDQKLMDMFIKAALKEMEAKKITGKATTPFLLSRLNELTEGKGLKANIALVKHNARVGADLALAYQNQRH